MRFRSDFIALGLVCFCAVPLFAQTYPSRNFADTLSRQLEEIVVTSTRSPQSNLSTPDAIQVLPPLTLKKRPMRSTPEVFVHSPGVFVQKTNHGGGSPFLRGLTGNQVLLLYDGIRLNNATFRYGPNQYFNTVDLFGVESAETMLGNGSVQYGSDALGGAIQLFSKKLIYSVKGEWNGQLIGQFATHGMEQTGRAELGRSGKRSAVEAGFTWRNFGDLLGGDTTGFQRPSGYGEIAADVKARFALNKHLDLTVLHQYVSQNEVPVYHKVVLENFAVNAFEPQNRALTYARLNGESTWAAAQKYSFTLLRQHSKEGRISQKNNSATLRNEVDEVETWGAVFQADSRAYGRWSVNNGLEFYYDKVQSGRTDTDQTTQLSVEKRGLYPDNSSMMSWAVFSLHEWDLKPWKVQAGARFNAFRIVIPEETLGKIIQKPGALVWNAALQRHITARAILFAAYNSGFRAPNIDDMGTLGIVDFRYEVPNYDLKPERVHNVQVGFKMSRERFRAEAYVYRNELRQVINRVNVPGDSIQGYPVYIKENNEKAFIQGAEIVLRYQISPHWRAEGFVAYAYGHNLTRREPLRRVPPVNGRLALTWNRGRWTAIAEGLAAQKQDRLAAGDKADNRIPAGGTPGWKVVNLLAGFETGRFNIFLAFNNLLDEDYRYHGSGINGVGRSASVRVGYLFD